MIERPLSGPKGTPGKERTRYIHDDHIGNADVITDEGGNVIERNSYDAFGKRRNPLWNNTNPPGPSILSTLGYTGHEDDDDLGLINMKGRLYDPSTGRMMQADPIIANIHNAQNLNRYSYVRNNPLTLIDPTGWLAGEGAPKPKDNPPPDPAPDPPAEPKGDTSGNEKTPPDHNALTFEGDTIRDSAEVQGQVANGAAATQSSQAGTRGPMGDGGTPRSLRDPCGDCKPVKPRDFGLGDVFEPGPGWGEKVEEYLMHNGEKLAGDVLFWSTLPISLYSGGELVVGAARAVSWGYKLGKAAWTAKNAAPLMGAVARGSIKQVGTAAGRSLPAGVKGFQSETALSKHFGKHAAEWGEGNITLQGYAKRAESLLRSEVGGDIQGFTSNNGYVFRYNAKTNEFATMKPNGVIETLFRPKDGVTYWMEQLRRFGP